MRLPAFLILLLAAPALLAQDVGKIAGVVRDRASKEPLPGVNITVRGTRLGATSDAQGQYFILNIPPGIYDVAASQVGYQTLTQQRVLVNVSRTSTLNFNLQERTVEMSDEVVVTATRPDVVAEKTSTSEIARPGEMGAMPGVVSLNDVLSLQADITDGHFRGGRENEELYLLAGMGIVNPLTSASAFAPILSAVEEVEVITSGFSAAYGNAQSGVINISMKEGKSDRWRSRTEYRMRMPGYKHFGPNVYDMNANPYLQLLNSPEKWGGADPTNPGNKYYSSISYGFDSRYKDTVQAAQMAYTLWKQARRNLNTSYNNRVDQSFDLNVGGPLSENARLFLAGRAENFWPTVPSEEPNTSRRAMGNITFDVGYGMSLRLSGAYSSDQGTIYRGLGSYNYSSFYYWIWDKVIGLSKTKSENTQMGVRFVHSLSNQTYYELKLNRLSTRYRDGAMVIDPNRYVAEDQNNAVWRYYNTPDQFRVGYMDNDFSNEQTGTISLDGSVTSQVTPSHLLLAGVQANLYTVDVENYVSRSDAGSARDEVYYAHPFELGVYAQDKMEFEGMIANVGLRVDVYNQNVDYYTNIYSPFRVDVPGERPYYDAEDAPQAKTPTIVRFQPRIGISFPVSVSTVFHMNYGTFLQRPAFERTVYMQYGANKTDQSGLVLGNPQLKPQDTKSYDVGFTQALGEGFTLDVSGYYKDVKNLIELTNYVDNQGIKYSTYTNRDYADIRGFRVTLSKRRGWLTGQAKYNFGVATGKSSTPFNASPTFYEPGEEGQPPDELPSPKDITLDFDRTHNLVINLTAASGEDWGPQFLGGAPLANISVSATSFFRSGRPYTFDTTGTRMINNRRSPMEYGTDLKISKRVDNLFGAQAIFYFEIANLFNQQIYSYNTVFQSVVTGSSSFINNNIKKYETDPSSLQYFDQFPPFLVDQTFLLYSNPPRSFFLGVVISM